MIEESKVWHGTASNQTLHIGIKKVKLVSEPS